MIFTVLISMFLVDYFNSPDNNCQVERMTELKVIEQIKKADWDATETMKNLGVGSVPKVIVYLDDSDPDVREVAIGCLGVVGGDEATKAVVDKLFDQDEYVVSAAVEYLHDYPPIKHQDKLLKAFNDSDDSFIHINIPLIIGKMGDRANKKPWIDKFQSQEFTDEYKEGIIVCLSRLGYQPARESFERIIAETEGGDSKVWLDYCKYMEDTWVVPCIIPLLDKKELALYIVQDRDLYRRTCDLAVITIVDVTKAEVSFSMEQLGQYHFAQQEIDEVRKLAESYK